MDDNKLGVGNGLLVGTIAYVSGALLANSCIYHNENRGTCSVAPNFGAALVDEQVARANKPLTDVALNIISRYGHETTASLKDCSLGARRVIDRVMERRIEFYRNQIH